MFSDLPAIFSGNLAEDGSQIEQGMLARFGASKVGGQALVPAAQGQRPGGDLVEQPSGRLCYDIGWRLHAASLSDVLLLKVLVFFQNATSDGELHEAFSLGLPSSCSAYKCHCSGKTLFRTGVIDHA